MKPGEQEMYSTGETVSLICTIQFRPSQWHVYKDENTKSKNEEE